MAQFESSLGNKKLTNTQMRELDIPDGNYINQENIVNPVVRRKMINEESMRNLQEELQHNASFSKNISEIEKEFKEAREIRKAKISGKERLNDGAKRRLEILLNMTRTTHTVDLEGNIFILQTIPSKSMREAIVKASEYDGTVQAPFEIRRQLLARSITQIAGVDFDQFVGSDLLDDRLLFIDEIDEPLLNKLYNEYLIMSEKAKNKYSIKNESDAKEVLEDLKK